VSHVSRDDSLLGAGTATTTNGPAERINSTGPQWYVQCVVNLLDERDLASASSAWRDRVPSRDSGRRRSQLRLELTVEVDGSADEREVSECLGKVPEQLSARPDLL
jgi:hypothetical protein